jgi:hypothetical protein
VSHHDACQQTRSTFVVSALAAAEPRAYSLDWTGFTSTELRVGECPSCDLGMIMDQAAEPIPAENPDACASPASRILPTYG